MTQLASDNFTRANGGLGANWTVNSSIGISGPLTISSNNAVSGSSGANMDVYTAVAAPNDGYAEITLGSAVDPTTDSGVWVIYRASTTAETGYFAQCNTVETRLYKMVAGVFTQLGSNGPAGAAGDVIRIICNGTAHTVTKNGTSIITATDSAIASGGAAIGAAPTQVDSISLFSFGNLGTVPSVGAVTLAGLAISVGLGLTPQTA